MESRQSTATSARAKTAVVLISDRPERFDTLRRAALPGRAVYLWLPNGHHAGAWPGALRGEPTDAQTYAPLDGREAIVVIDVADPAHAEDIAGAVSRALPLPSVLLIDRSRSHRRGGSGGGMTWIDEGELLADAVEVVLSRAAARKRVRGLRRALRGSASCAFLVQNDPDPDAIASALALRRTLDVRADRSPIITCGHITRPENRRLIEELGVRVRHVTKRELLAAAPLILVDVQPPYFGDTLSEVAAVVDHHPSSGPYRARFRDVRTTYGASATMAAEYLIAENPQALGRPLATALLYGIMTDTKSLSRSASEDDLEMFAYLFPRADQAMLRRIQHPSYSPITVRRLGSALQHARVRDGLAYVHLGRLPDAEEHVVAQFAEFCLGMAGAEVSAVSGVFGTKVAMSTRALSPDAQLGERLRATFLPYGSAGGHPVMAKAVIDIAAWREDHPYQGASGLERSILRALRRALRTPVNSLSATRARR